MTLAEAVEKAARAICINAAFDPDDLVEWGPFIAGSAFRARPDQPRWKCVAEHLHIPEMIIVLEVISAIPPLDRKDAVIDS